MPRFEAITFNCYGTLIDWEQGILKALAPFLSRLSDIPSPEKILSLYGELESAAEKTWRPYKEVLRIVMKSLAEKLGFTLLPGEDTALVKSLPSWMPFPETNQALEELSSRGIKLVIISNIDQDLIAQTLRHFTISFDLIITAEEARCYKPDLKIFKIALEKLALPKEKILHVGQSVFHDIIPAKILGLTTCWVKRPGRDPYGATPKAQANPDFVIRDLRELLTLF